MGKGSRGAGRRGRKGHPSTSAQSQQNAAPQQQQQSSQSGREQPQASAQPRQLFSVDDPETWVKYLRQSKDVIQDFEDALEQRFLIPWRAVRNERQTMKAAGFTIDYLSRRIVDVLAAATQSEFDSIFAECKDVYYILEEADRKFASNSSVSRDNPSIALQSESESPASTPRQHTVQMQPVRDDDEAFNVDDLDTWVDFVKKHVEPLADMYWALKERFLTLWTRACSEEQKGWIYRMLVGLSRDAVCLAKTNSVVERTRITQECEFDYAFLKFVDRQFRKKYPQSSNIESQARQRQPPAETGKRSGAAFSVDDPNTWFEYLKRGRDPLSNFDDALKRRFRTTIEYSMGTERQMWAIRLFSELVAQAGCLQLGNLPDDAVQHIVRQCELPLLELQMAEREYRKGDPQKRIRKSDPVPDPPQPAQATAASQPQLQPQQSSRSAAFSVEDPDTWVDFLRGSSDRYQVMRSALVQRFASPLETFLSAENMRSLTLKLENLSKLAMILVGVTSQEDYQDVLTKCKAECEKLKDTDRKAHETIALLAASGKTSAQPQQQHQQRQQQQQAPSLTAAQPSQRSTQLDSAFSVDDLSTWAEFMRKSKSPHQDLHDALTERFVLPCTMAPTKERKTWVENTLSNLCGDALRLSLTASQIETASLLKKCKRQYKALKEMDDELKKKQLQSSASQPTSAPRQTPPAAQSAASPQKPQSVPTKGPTSSPSSPPAATAKASGDTRAVQQTSAAARKSKCNRGESKPQRSSKEEMFSRLTQHISGEDLEIANELLAFFDGRGFFEKHGYGEVEFVSPDEYINEHGELCYVDWDNEDDEEDEEKWETTSEDDDEWKEEEEEEETDGDDDEEWEEDEEEWDDDDDIEEEEEEEEEEEQSEDLGDSQAAGASAQVTFAQREIEALQMQMAAAPAGLFPTLPAGGRVGVPVQKSGGKAVKRQRGAE